MATITLRPSAAGDLTEVDNQFPNSGEHWDKVDEETADDDTTYIYSSTSTTVKHDLYNLPSAPVGMAEISDVTVWARCKKSTADFPLMNFTITLKTGTTHAGSSAKILSDSWGNFSNSWATNPETGVAWTVADINALQIGVSLKGTTTAPTQYTLCTQVWVVITYTLLEGLVGTVWQETTKLHWIDENGAEQSKEGTAISASESPAPPANLWFENFLTSQLLYVDMSTTGRKRLDGVATGVVGQPKGTIWIEGADLHGIDFDGDEVYIEGG